jgi:hypothetical protein
MNNKISIDTEVVGMASIMSLLAVLAVSILFI